MRAAVFVVVLVLLTGSAGAQSDPFQLVGFTTATYDGDETLFGMKQFSLHHPRERNYAYEWLFHQALKREGLLGLRYLFVDVTLNGTHLGVYALEEHFEKRLLAKSSSVSSKYVEADNAR